MKKILGLLLLLLLFSGAAQAQTAVQFGRSAGNLCVYDQSATRQCATVGAINDTTHVFVPVPSGAAGTSGQLQINNGGPLGGVTLGGDCTFSTPNLTCTKSGGTAFGTGAFTATYVLPTATNSTLGGVLAQSSYVGATGLGSAANANTGAAGATLCLLNSNCNWSGAQTITSSVFGQPTLNIQDTARAVSDTQATVNISATEAVTPGASGTRYGINATFTEGVGANGDRIGASFIQQCNATASGKSCVGESDVAVAGTSFSGNFTGANPRVLIPAGMSPTGGGAVGGEADAEVHSVPSIVNGWRVVIENQSGGALYHGTVEDCGLCIVKDQSNTTTGDGFNYGIQFGENGYANSWPIPAGGTLIGAFNPGGIVPNYGVDFTGMAGFNYAAIALPINQYNNSVQWGYNAVGGKIYSTATGAGPQIEFTDSGLYITKSTGTGIFSFLQSGYQVDGGVVYVSPSTGQTVTIASTRTVIDPTGSLAALAIAMPASPVSGQLAYFSCTQPVAAVTFSGGTLANAPSTFTAGVKYSYVYIASKLAWYPLN